MEEWMPLPHPSSTMLRVRLPAGICGSQWITLAVKHSDTVSGLVEQTVRKINSRRSSKKKLRSKQFRMSVWGFCREMPSHESLHSLGFDLSGPLQFDLILAEDHRPRELGRLELRDRCPAAPAQPSDPAAGPQPLPAKKVPPLPPVKRASLFRGPGGSSVGSAPPASGFVIPPPPPPEEDEDLGEERGLSEGQGSSCPVARGRSLRRAKSGSSGSSTDGDSELDGLSEFSDSEDSEEGEACRPDSPLGAMAFYVVEEAEPAAPLALQPQRPPPQLPTKRSGLQQQQQRPPSLLSQAIQQEHRSRHL